MKGDFDYRAVQYQHYKEGKEIHDKDSLVEWLLDSNKLLDAAIVQEDLEEVDTISMDYEIHNYLREAHILLTLYPKTYQYHPNTELRKIACAVPIPMPDSYSMQGVFVVLERMFNRILKEYRLVRRDSNG